MPVAQALAEDLLDLTYSWGQKRLLLIKMPLVNTAA